MATQQEVFNSLTTEILRIGAKLDGMRGPGVTNTPKTITINSVSASKPNPAIPPPAAAVKFASIDTTWTSGNWVNAHLMDGVNTTTNTLQLALTSPPQYNPPASSIGWCHLAANDVVAYQPLDKTVYLVDGLIISPNITAQGTAIAQVLQVTGLTPLKHGFDWVLSHP